MKQNVWMFNLTYDRNGEYNRDDTPVQQFYRAAKSRKIVTHDISRDIPHGVIITVNKSDAMVLKLAGFSIYSCVTTLEELTIFLGIPHQNE